MFNKKAMGIGWYALILAFLISVGILMYSASSMRIPKIGEFSLSAMKDLENGNNIPIAIEIIMEEVNKKSTDDFGNHKVFQLKSYCENQDYKDSLAGKKFPPPAWLSKRTEAKCLVDRGELGKYYSESFDNGYQNFKSRKFNNFNLDFSNINYIYSVKKEDNKFFMEAIAGNKLEIPIKTVKGGKEKQIGKFYLNPSFKLPVDYNFDEPSKEVCIFSVDCGATCEYAINYFGYELKADPCGKYYDCSEAEFAKDDFGKYYCEGKGYLCQGKCLPYCFSNDPDLVVDADENTKCKDVSCSSYMSCGTINPANKCGCPADSYACEGTDCDTLHCDRDAGTNTNCKGLSCGSYGSCSGTSLCGCDSPPNACEGSCYCNPYNEEGGCGDEGCGNGKPTYTLYDPPTCSDKVFSGCSGCLPECDSCGCNRGPECGPCGWDCCDTCSPSDCGVSKCGQYCGNCPVGGTLSKP